MSHPYRPYTIQNVSVLDHGQHRDVLSIPADEWDTIKARWHRREKEPYGIKLPCCGADALPVFGGERQRFFRHQPGSECEVVTVKSSPGFDIRRHIDLVSLLHPHKGSGLLDHFHHLPNGRWRRAALHCPERSISIMAAASKATPDALREIDEQLAEVGARTIWVFADTPSAALCDFIAQNPGRCFVTDGKAVAASCYRPVPYDRNRRAAEDRFFKRYFEQSQMAPISDAPGAFLVDVAEGRRQPQQVTLTHDYLVTARRLCGCGRELLLPNVYRRLERAEAVLSFDVEPLSSLKVGTETEEHLLQRINGLPTLDQRFALLVRNHMGALRCLCPCGKDHPLPYREEHDGAVVEIPSEMPPVTITSWAKPIGLAPSPDITLVVPKRKEIGSLKPPPPPPAPEPVRRSDERLRRLISGARPAPKPEPPPPPPHWQGLRAAIGFEMTAEEKAWSRQLHNRRLEIVDGQKDLYLSKRADYAETVERLSARRHKLLEVPDLERHETMLNVILAETGLWPEDPIRTKFFQKLYRLECEALVMKRRLLDLRAYSGDFMKSFYQAREVRVA